MQKYLKIEEILNARKNDFIHVETEGSTRYIIYNRPGKGNAFTVDMFYNATKAINEASKDLHIKFIVIYGRGNSFSTGNDLTNFIDPDFAEEFTPSDLIPFLAKIVLEDYALAIVSCHKPIYAISHGYATGAGFTQLGLYDGVYAVDGGKFRAPLVKLAQGPQMGSSYTFPKHFGKNLTLQIIVDARQMTSQQLVKLGFAKGARSVEDGLMKVKEYLKMMDKLDYQSLMECRNLLRRSHQKELFEVIQLECRNLVERWLHPNLMDHVVVYMQEEKQKQKQKGKGKQTPKL